MSSEILFSIPIIGTIVLGLIAITYIYLKSRERQMMIEKGLSADQIKVLLEKRSSRRTINKEGFILLKMGIICFFFGLGLGIGLMLAYSTGKAYWIPLFMFTLTGVGLVAANLAGRKLAKDACQERPSEEDNPQGPPC